MTSISTDQTLAELVNNDPSSTRVFETYGLDYCCGGKQSLAKACERAGIDVQKVVDELQGLTHTEQVDWMSINPAQLASHIESTHHVYLHSELPRLEALCAKVVRVHGERRLELAEIQTTYLELKTDLDPHLMKEEQVLFPMIRELTAASEAPSFHCGSLQNPISVMLREHEIAGALLQKLRVLTNQYEPPADACASYRALYAGLADLEADTHLHIHKENNVLFPAAIELEATLLAQHA